MEIEPTTETNNASTVTSFEELATKTRDKGVFGLTLDEIQALDFALEHGFVTEDQVRGES